MSKKKFSFYAVKKGRTQGIYQTWEDCAVQVDGYAGAVYKGFHTRADAESFLRSEERQGPNMVTPLAQVERVSPTQVIIFTDGASIGNPGPGGYAAIMLYGKHRKEVKGGYRLTTNNRMEIMAALVGLGMLKRPCSVSLHTDSKYLCDAMTNGWVSRWQKNGWRTIEGKPVANVDLWQQLLTQAAKHQVSFEWVRGHNGNSENERCDQIATQMATLKNLPADIGYEKQFTENPQFLLLED